MRRLIILLFGVITAIPALCQFPDTTKLSWVFVPVAYEKSYMDIIQMEYKKTIDKYLNTGGIIHYQPASADGNTAKNTMVRALITQIAMNADIKPEEIIMLNKLIEEISKAGIYVPPTGPPGNPPPDPDIVIVIDNVVAETANAYSSGWLHYANLHWNTNHNDSSLSVTYTVGSTNKISFEGYKIEWWTELRMNHGVASVSIDGGPEIEVDLYRKREDNNSEKVWTSPNLTNGPHTLTIKMTGKKNPAWNADYPTGNSFRAEAQGNNIVHDAVVVYSK